MPAIFIAGFFVQFHQNLTKNSYPQKLSISGFEKLSKGGTKNSYPHM